MSRYTRYFYKDGYIAIRVPRKIIYGYTTIRDYDSTDMNSKK